MKGIVLAGGSGTRLYPITRAISKQLMPIYDKPMIYYPISTLFKAGIRDILIIVNAEYIESFKRLLDDGSQLGVSFSYIIQDSPRGLADAYILGEDFIGEDSVGMILGDNIFYGSSMESSLSKYQDITGGVIFGCEVDEPKRYGVVEFDHNKKVISIEEKPENPRSNYAIPGLYFFDNRCVEFAKNVKPSARGEIEITEIHQQYLDIGELKVEILDRGTAWLDTGTFESMNSASTFVEVIEKRQGFKIGCIEEEAYRQGFISRSQLAELAKPLMKSGYGEYLMKIVNNI
jgi:glucose-1-phosphate thymidylyltransferase